MPDFQSMYFYTNTFPFPRYTVHASVDLISGVENIARTQVFHSHHVPHVSVKDGNLDEGR
jgi:hypothetical protein